MAGCVPSIDSWFIGPCKLPSWKWRPCVGNPICSNRFVHRITALRTNQVILGKSDLHNFGLSFLLQAPNGSRSLASGLRKCTWCYFIICNCSTSPFKYLWSHVSPSSCNACWLSMVWSLTYVREVECKYDGRLCKTKIICIQAKPSHAFLLLLQPPQDRTRILVGRHAFYTANIIEWYFQAPYAAFGFNISESNYVGVSAAQKRASARANYRLISGHQWMYTPRQRDLECLPPMLHCSQTDLDKALPKCCNLGNFDKQSFPTNAGRSIAPSYEIHQLMLTHR